MNRSGAVSRTSRSKLEYAATGFQHSRAPVHGKILHTFRITLLSASSN